MAGFDNRYGTEYGGLASQMTGVATSNNARRARKLADRFARDAHGRAIESIHDNDAAARASARSGSVDGQLSLARLFADQSQHNEKMGLDQQRLGLDTARFGFDQQVHGDKMGLDRDRLGLDSFKANAEVSKLQAESALLQQEFAGINAVSAAVNNPLVAALAQAGQLDKAENVQRALLTQAIADGRATDDDVIRFGAGWGDYIGENQAASLAGQGVVASRNASNARKSAALENPESMADLISQMSADYTGIADEGRSYTFFGNPNDRRTVVDQHIANMSPRARAAMYDGMAAAETAEERQQVFMEATGLDDMEFQRNRIRGAFGQGTKLKSREMPTEDELAGFEEAGLDPDIEAYLAGKYPEWHAEFRATRAAESDRLRTEAQNQAIIEQIRSIAQRRN